jgi:dTDP-glucose pyrophosphorylase
MKDWERTLLAPDASLRDAMRVIDEAGRQIGLVVAPDRRLLGTITDGDLRRALLRGAELTDPASIAMHPNPRVARLGESAREALAQMRRLGLHQLPVVDDQGVVRGLSVIDDFLAVPERGSWVVIMAGGLGTRLEELTKDVPKPMLRVGDRPILETIVRSLIDQGFRRFFFAVNYKAEQIEAHFGDGAELGIEIRYLRERMRMGTAGALSVLPEAPTEPLVVTNGDILSQLDYGAMVDNHIAASADATMAVRDYEFQIPFGVVHVRDDAVAAVEEKPVQRFLVSAGMYVLSPPAVALVPSGTYFDMPSLFDAVLAAGLRTRTHHVDGYWLDIGRRADFERANAEFGRYFK